MTITYLSPKKVHFTSADLKCCEQLILWSIRIWVMGLTRKSDIKPDLTRAYAKYNISNSVTLFDHFMYCLTFGAKNCININCPLRGTISPDELTLLNIFANFQQKNNSLATSMLSHLCEDKYLMQARSHALVFANIIQEKGLINLTCHKIENITDRTPQQENFPIYMPSFAG